MGQSGAGDRAYSAGLSVFYGHDGHRPVTLSRGTVTAVPRHQGRRPHVTQDQSKALWDRFNELNAAGGGVSQKDVRDLLVDQGGWKPEDVDTALRGATGGTDARIDTRTFSSLVPKSRGTATEQSQRMQDAFKGLDTDGTGITEAQLRQLLMDVGSALTSPEVDELMKEVVVNSEGRITDDAFNDMLTTGYPFTSE